MALQVFYDKSGDKVDPNCRFLTLVGLVGEEDTWKDLTKEWTKALTTAADPSCPAPRSPRGKPYFHSKEAFHNKDGYAGWDSGKTMTLVGALLDVLSRTGQADPLALTCSINMADYHKVRNRIPNLRMPEDICLDVAFGPVILHPHRDNGIKVIFDRREKFYGILRKAWKSKDRNAQLMWWAKYVSSIEEVDDSRERPEIQAADLLAWLANRYSMKGPNDQWGRLFFFSFLVKKHYYDLIDETSLDLLFEPDGKMRHGVSLPPPKIIAPSM